MPVGTEYSVVRDDKVQCVKVLYYIPNIGSLITVRSDMLYVVEILNKKEASSRGYLAKQSQRSRKRRQLGSEEVALPTIILRETPLLPKKVRSDVEISE